MGRPISLPEAAEMMGVPPQLLRVGLQQQKFPWGVAIKMKKNYAVSKEVKMTNYLAESDDALSLFIDIVDSKMGEQLARAPKHQHDSIRYTYQYYINKASALKDEWIKQCEDDRLYGF